MAIGVAALIVVISVMTGFGNNLREKIIGTTPHNVIEKETPIKNYKLVGEELNKVEGVRGSSPYIQGNIFLESFGQSLGLVARGIAPETENIVTKVDSYIVKGQLSELKGDNIIVGRELARYFGFSLGDSVTIIAPGSGMAGQGWRYRFENCRHI